jgi:hypothetical protein
LAAAVIVLAATVFVADAWPRLSASFGNSQDGVNGAMWASGAAAIADDGVVASRIGAVAPGRDVYAHHPPAIFAATAVARVIGGDGETALRAPAWLASLASIPLMWLLLRRTGASTAAAICGLVAFAGSEMFLLYGAMLNFEALALPIVLATLLVVVEPPGGRTPRWWPAFLLGVAGALVSWEGILFAFAVAAWGEWRRRAGHPAPGRTRSLAAGAALGTALSLAWMAWANGGLAETWRALRTRTDGTVSGVGDQISTQWHYLHFNFAWWSLALAAFGAAVLLLERDRRRPSHVLLVVVPLTYLVALAGGAFFHPYWNYWLVITIGLFVAVGADHIAGSSRLRGITLASLAVVLLVAAPQLVDDPARTHIEYGSDAADLVRAHSAGTDEVWVWPLIRQPDFWVTYYTGNPVVVLPDEDLDAFVARDPTHPVLVWELAVDQYEGSAMAAALRAVAIDARSEYLVVPADRLATVLAVP